MKSVTQSKCLKFWSDCENHPVKIYGGPRGRVTRRCLCDDDDATIDDDDATIDNDDATIDGDATIDDDDASDDANAHTARGTGQ